MNKLELKDVTLVCIDDFNTKMASEIIEGVSSFINFTDVKLFSSKDEPYVTDKIKPITNLVDYSVFVVKELHKYINTEYVMFIQTDGYPINIEAWTDENYRYDYIGAPWTWAPHVYREKICPVGSCVGNGGFSFRTKKILEEISQYDYNPEDKELVALHSGTGTEVEEDSFMCRVMGKELKSAGIKFAPCELASYFSVENRIYAAQFGFHGRETITINKKLKVFLFKDHAYEKNMD